MSVVLDTTYAGEAFEVEIFHDGHIEFPGHNLEYEQAMAEFGQPSAVVEFDDYWNKDPIGAFVSVLVRNSIGAKNMALIAMEYAERVLHIGEDAHAEGGRARILLDASRKYVDGTIDRNALKVLRASMKDLGRRRIKTVTSSKTHSVAAAQAAVYSASNTAFLCLTSKSISWTQFLRTVRVAATEAAEAVAYDFCAAAGLQPFTIEKTYGFRGKTWSTRQFTDCFNQAMASEVAWQVRRFVDVLEALGQGFDWPDMKVTP